MVSVSVSITHLEDCFFPSVSTTYFQFLSPFSVVKIPSSVAEALTYPRWKASLYEEMSGLGKNNMWTLPDY